MKIFVYEMKKILIKQYAIIILAAVVIVRLLSSLPLAKQTYGFDSATEREKYFEIISPFIGAVTEEKTDRADELENQLKTASQQYDKLIDQRLEHKISDIEYYEQMKLYEPTLNIKKQIEKTVEQVRQAQERQCDILPVSYIPIICDARPITFVSCNLSYMQSECNHRVYKQDKIYPVYYSGRTVTQYGGKNGSSALSGRSGIGFTLSG